MKPVRFHPAAEAEFAQVVSFYDKERPRLGTEFAEAVERAAEFIQSDPEAGTPVRTSLRRWLVRRFPYTPIDRDEPEGVYILAVAHHRRKPGYWQHRV